jgi:hypothetical protein
MAKKQNGDNSMNSAFDECSYPSSVDNGAVGDSTQCEGSDNALPAAGVNPILGSDGALPTTTYTKINTTDSGE